MSVRSISGSLACSAADPGSASIALPPMAARPLPAAAARTSPHLILTAMHDADAIEMTIPPDDFFRTLELRRTRALVERDLATLEELHAPDYELITPAGKVFLREAYLGAIRAEPFYAEWLVGPMSFRTSARMAVVRYMAHLRFPTGREVVCWHMDSYERRAQGWQAVWSQATGIPRPVGQS